MGCYQEGNPKKKNSIEIKANQKLDEQTSNKKEEIANETEKKKKMKEKMKEKIKKQNYQKNQMNFYIKKKLK